MTTPTVAILAVKDAAQRLGKTEGWYLAQLRAHKLPGLKVGRQWLLTEADFATALDLMRQPATPVVADPAGLTPTSRRRLTRGAR